MAASADSAAVDLAEASVALEAAVVVAVAEVSAASAADAAAAAGLQVVGDASSSNFEARSEKYLATRKPRALGVVPSALCLDTVN